MYCARRIARQISLWGCLWVSSISLPGSRPAQTPPPITLSVDATHARNKILHVHLEMPVHPGPLTLYYPKWIAGMHEPAGPIANLTGLAFTAGTHSLPWRRDLLDVFTFHIDIPDAADTLSISFDYLEPNGSSGPTNGMTSDKLMVLNWYQVVLYPAGTPVSQLTYKAALQLPQGWHYGTALHASPASGSGDDAKVEFEPASLSRLVDSPLVAGEYYRAIDLTPPGEPIHHEIDIAGESEAALAMPDDFRKGLINLVAESGKLFGSRHYGEYHFLLTLSDHTAHFGVEHHESNDSRLGERALITPAAAHDGGALLAHEFAHSWSGKFRRPQGEDVADYQTPMKTDLLWVYEGSTSYFGDLLAARSGLWTQADYQQALATYAASLGVGRPGRTWRSVLDTAVAVPGMFGGGGWLNWRRGADYYEEGELIWLEVAAIIHVQSRGAKSFDDFARLFYGGPNRGPEMKPYLFQDLVSALNSTVPYSWAEFLNGRLTSTSADGPLAGIEAVGWRLTFTTEPPKGERSSRATTASTYPLGLTLSADGVVSDAVYDGPAFKAGIAPGMKVAAVNGRVYSADVLNDAIKRTKEIARPLELLVIDDDYYRTCKIEYQGGEKYPHLIRNESKPDYLAELLKP
jgi:predicted metalloprotease with PDZ domain